MLKKIGVIAVAFSAVFNANAEQVLDKIGSNEILWGGSFVGEGGSPMQPSKYTKADSGAIQGKAPTGIVENIVGSTNNSRFGYSASGSFYLALRNAADKNFTYGVHAGALLTEKSKDFVGKDLQDRSYLYLQGHNWGRVELGSNEGAAPAMKIQGSYFNAGEGSWEKYVSLNSFSSASNYTSQLVRSSNFIKSASLEIPGGEYESNHEAERKVTYYSPKLHGFQFGASYIPDTDNKGGKVMSSSGPARSAANAVSAGITFDKDLGNARSMGLSLVGERGNIKASSVDKANQRAFNKTQVVVLGAKYIVDKWSFAASYGDKGYSDFQKDIMENTVGGPVIKPKRSYYYSIGSSYKLHERSNVSLFYLHSNRNTNKFNLVTLAGDYVCMPGLKLYSEYSYFKGVQKRDYIEPKGADNSAILPNGASTNRAVMLTGQSNKIDGSIVIAGIGVYF